MGTQRLNTGQKSRNKGDICGTDEQWKMKNINKKTYRYSSAMF